MPPEQSNSRGSYARRGGGYNPSGGRGPWRGRGKGKNNHGKNDNNSDGEDDFEVGGARNNQYPGRSQNPDVHNNSNGKRWERPRTSTQKNTYGVQQFEQDDVNMPMVQADEIPSQALHTAPLRSKRKVTNCPWIDWDVYLPLDGKLRTPVVLTETNELFWEARVG